jgi:predicted RNA-binding protein YlxR (DUF448 family)
VVRQAEGGVVLDQGMGRSAYLCPQLSCLEEARKRRRLQRALRCPLDERLLDVLMQRLSNEALRPTPP